MAAIFAFHMGKVIIDPEKCFKIILHAPMMIRQLQIHSTIDGGRRLHDLSPLKKSNHHRIDLWQLGNIHSRNYLVVLYVWRAWGQREGHMPTFRPCSGMRPSKCIVSLYHAAGNAGAAAAESLGIV
jgi:hypothetical protein